MTKGMLRARKLVIPKAPIIRQDIKVDLTLANLDGASGIAWDTGVIAGLPQGNILLLGAVLNATVTKIGASITDTFDGDFSIGSAATGDTTLSGGEVDIIPSTSFGGAATDGVKVVRGASTGTESGAILNNTDGSLELNLNVLIDDAAISGDNQSISVEGVLHLAYIVLGDD